MTADNPATRPLARSWAYFDDLAWRHLGDGLTDAEALDGVRAHHPAKFWPAANDQEAQERIEAIRSTLPPPRTEAEALAMLDKALDERFGRPATPALVPTAVKPTKTRRRPGRPKGSGRVIPNPEHLIDEYVRVSRKIGRPPTLPEFADSYERLGGGIGVGEQTVRDALDAYDLPWPPVN